MHTLSALVICMNEEDRIRPCMESLQDFADEIIVFDSGSTDATVDIVREYTDKVWITEDWPGDGFQKQRALDQASCDWALIIDADEWLDDAMQTSIRNILAQDTIEENAFKLPLGQCHSGQTDASRPLGPRHPSACSAAKVRASHRSSCMRMSKPKAKPAPFVTAT